MARFAEPPEVDLVRRSARDFAKKHFTPKLLYRLDRDEEFSPELTRQMGKDGLLGMTAGTDHGGSGLNHFEIVAAVEELARVDSSQAATVAAHNSLGLAPICAFGTVEQKERYLPGLTSGEGLWALALTEPNFGSDLKNIQMRAGRSGEGWILNGEKVFITNGACELTAGITVFANTGVGASGRKEQTCFLVPADARGLTAEPIRDKHGWRATSTARFVFDGVYVSKWDALGEVGRGFKTVMEILNRGRLTIAAIGLGLSQGAFEMTLEYIQNRRAFGGPLSDLQDVRKTLSRMAEKIKATRLMLLDACYLCENGEDFKIEAAMAKVTAAETAAYCAIEGMKLHGAYGCTKEFPIERFCRDQAILQVGEGATPVLRELISRSILDQGFYGC